MKVTLSLVSKTYFKSPLNNFHLPTLLSSSPKPQNSFPCGWLPSTTSLSLKPILLSASSTTTAYTTSHPTQLNSYLAGTQQHKVLETEATQCSLSMEAR